MPIPKQIFQCFKTKNLSAEFQDIVNTWRTHHPQYQYTLYDDRDCELFILQFFDKRIVEAYRRILPGGFKADLWRCCVLYICGGIYVDIDTLCIGNMDHLLQCGADFIAPIDLSGDHMLFNSFIAAAPRSPILLDCINRIVCHVESNYVPENRLEFSGPGVLGRAVNVHLGRSEHDRFRGMEGLIGSVYLLSFDSVTEYVRDRDTVLFQNKNGNQRLRILYHNECQRISTICWFNSSSVLL
jgi:hypothetical protein